MPSTTKPTKQKSKKQSRKTKKPARFETETQMIVKVNGREVQHPLRKFFTAVGFIITPLIVGLIASALTGDAMMTFNELSQPPLAPPAWLFPVAWSILYLLMGIASYLIYRINPKIKPEKDLRTTELIIFYIQLAFNFFWTLLFFKWELRFSAFGWLIAMWSMILALIIMAFKNRKAAAWILFPYLIWCTFAAYLNIMVAILN